MPSSSLRGALLLGLLLTLVGPVAPALAQIEQPRVMTLPEALAYARAHQPALRAARARLAATRADARVPRAAWLPRAGATAQFLGGTANNTTASYGRTSQVDIARIGGTRAGAEPGWVPYPSTLAAVGVQQEVFDFGRIAAVSAVADALEEVDAHGAEAERLAVELNVEEAYLAVNAARAVLEASEDAYTRARIHRDQAAATVRGGLRAPIELTRAEADLARFDVGRIRARGGVEVAQSVFAAAVGVPDLRLDAAKEAPAPRDLPSLPTALAQAAARDPALQAMLARLKVQEAQTRAITAQLRPDLSLTGSLSGRAGGAPPSAGMGQIGGWWPEVPNWHLGLVLNVPIFDGVVLAQRRASLLREEVRQAEVAGVRQQQVAAVQQGYIGVQVALAALAGLERSVEAAKANYAQADARFKAGLGTSVELADAEMVRTDAEIQQVLGRFELARARARFGRLIAAGL